jgi:hypothetical protein
MWKTAVIAALFAVVVVNAQDYIAPEDALVQEEDIPSVLPAPGGDVASIIPKFQTGNEWAHADEEQRAGYNKMNDLFKKLNKKKFEAQGKKRKELNAKADKALVALKEAKEGIQKKYAKDDPVDFPGAKLTSADKANKILDAHAKKTETGTYGASGNPWDKPKFYTDGVISSNAYRDEDGHYLLGMSRRRIGAGFGRRRRIASGSGQAPADEPLSKNTQKEIEKGHDVLKEAFGKPKDPKPLDEQTSGILDEGKEHHEDAEQKEHDEDDEQAKADAEAEAESGAVPTPKPTLAPGVKEADKDNMSPETKEELKATGAGADAEVDPGGHFTEETNTKIVGKKEAEELDGDQEKTLVEPLV